MFKILVAGAGKIGTLIACMLSQVQEYQIYLIDIHFAENDETRLLNNLSNVQCDVLNITDQTAVSQYIQQHHIQAVISSLPYYANVAVAQLAKAHQLHYFDLTEDIHVTQVIKELAKDAENIFVPQCGLAPGFINIAANSIMQQFESLDSGKLRVGALPQFTSNDLHYALTWSTDGLINEYGNECHGIVAGELVNLQPLEGLEALEFDGMTYEAFNTSGGLGSLAEIYQGKINTLNYKTIRYPGHCEKIRFLMNDLKLNDDRDTLKKIFEHALPKTHQDLVLVYIAINGYQQQQYLENSYLKKIYPQTIAGLNWSAIQVATAAGICAVVDLVLSQIQHYRGLILQEKFSLNEFLQNRFGHYYA